jgi:hypothetical protein
MLDPALRTKRFLGLDALAKALRVLVIATPLALSSCVSSESLTRTNAGATPLPSAYDFGVGASDTPAGIYPGTGSDNCCLVGPSATLSLARPKSATTLNIVLYRPVLPAHPKLATTMLVSFNGRDTAAVVLEPGPAAVSIPLPKATQGKPELDVGLLFPKPFVPKDEGMGTDTRHLSIVLSKVTLTDESPPDLYDFSLGMTTGVPSGIYADASPATCCFTGPNATLRLVRPRAATNLNISLYQPRLPKHPSQEAEMIVSFDGNNSQDIAHLGPGFHLVSLTLPKTDSKDPVIAIGLRFPKSFVPLDEGMGQDTRHIGVVLRKVTFSDESPPRAFDFTRGMPSGVPLGMYADASASMCCFAGPSATFHFAPPQKAMKLKITFYQPALPAHPHQEGTMIVSFNGGDRATVDHIKPGYHVVSLPLPKTVASKTPLSVVFDFPKPFVPQREGMGSDIRRLSIVIRKVELQ